MKKFYEFLGWLNHSSGILHPLFLDNSVVERALCRPLKIVCVLLYILIPRCIAFTIGNGFHQDSLNITKHLMQLKGKGGFEGLLVNRFAVRIDWDWNFI